MKVRDIMTQPARTCGADTSVAMAGRRMQDGLCGILPVIDGRGKLIGVVTDRDLFLITAGTRRSASNVTVHEAMTQKVVTCGPNDEIAGALGIMRTRGVRRLPVVDLDGHLLGLLSIDDIVQWGVNGSGVSATDVVNTLREIVARRSAPMELDAADL
jgi:CBS domain-containing protein